MNTKKYKKIEKLVSNSYEYLLYLNDIYDLGKVSFTVFNSTYIPSKSYKIELVRTTLYENDVKMLTVSFPMIDADSDCLLEDSIIKDFESDIYLSREQLYFRIIQCNLDFDKVIESLKFSIRHEVGHIIHLRKTYIGTKYAILKKDQDEYLKQKISLPKLRKNASNKSLIEWTFKFFEIPMEKAANEAVGITKDDIIKDCERTFG